jgi:transposase InsO family protein
MLGREQFAKQAASLWNYDIVNDKTSNSKPSRILNIIDEFLNGEVFDTLNEAQILIEWRRHEYNTIRPHSIIGYKPPAPVVAT